MSFLNLRRLLPAKEVWKIFTNKLQIKLLKLNRSKAIQKPNMQLSKTSKKLSWHSLSIQPKKFKLTPKPHTLVHFNKTSTPMYVDPLFMDSVSAVKGGMHPSLAALRKESNKKKSCSSTSFKSRGGSVQNKFPPRTGKEAAAAITSDQKSNKADDMWESVVLTSPQKKGINERAEEFIARFRTQLHHQEMLARRL